MTKFSLKCGTCGEWRDFTKIEYVENEKEGTCFLCIYCKLLLKKVEAEFDAEGIRLEGPPGVGKVDLGKRKGRRFWWRRKKGEQG